MKFNDSHKQVKIPEVLDEYGKPIKVDILMADVIKTLNAKGFATQFCCSGHEEDAFISYYILFYPLSKKHETNLKKMIFSIDGIYYEEHYEIHSTVDAGSTYIQLTNPTKEEIKTARKLATKNGKFEIYSTEEDEDDYDTASVFETNKIVIRYCKSCCNIGLPELYLANEKNIEVNRQEICRINKEIETYLVIRNW